MIDLINTIHKLLTVLLACVIAKLLILPFELFSINLAFFSPV